MTEKPTCKTCNKEFTTVSNLAKHNKTPCSIEPKRYVCTYCDGILTRSNILVSHMKQCPKKGEYELRQTYEALAKEFEEQNIQFTEYKSQAELQIKSLKESLDKSISDHEKYRENNRKAIESFKDCISDKDKRIEFLRGKIKVLETRDQEYMKQDRAKQVNITNINNTNNTVNNLYIQNLEPITDELIRETGSKIGMMDLKEGAPGIMRKFQPVLKNKIICTDASRNSLMYNYNGKLKRDSRGQMITDKIISSTEPQYRTYKEEIDAYYKNLDPDTMTETERARKDYQFDNYKEYSRAMNTKSEFGIKKVSKRVTQTIVNFSKTRSQFEAGIESIMSQQQDQYQIQEQPEDLDTQLQMLVSDNPSEHAKEPFPVENNCRFNKVVSRRQTLLNNRVYELHLDAENRIVHKFRLRSSGLPYLTDEETDPESRDNSDWEPDNDDQECNPEDIECENKPVSSIQWPDVDIQLALD